MRNIYCLSALFILIGVGANGCSRETNREEPMRPASRTEEPRAAQPKAQVPVTENPQRPATETNPAAARVRAASAQAISEITRERCDRETKCNNIGHDAKGKSLKYATRAECERKLTKDISDDLSPKHCKKGIDQDQLAKCSKEIREESCNSPLDTLDRVVTCRTSALCRD